MPEMDSSPENLVTQSMWKQIFGTGGVLIGSLVAASLFDSLGPQYMGPIVGVVGLITVWLTLGGLRETDKTLGEPIRVIEGLRATLQNQQFLIMFASTLIVHVACAVLQANLPYFVTLAIRRDEADVSIFLGIAVILMMAFAPIWNWISRRYPNRRLMTISIISLAIVSALNYSVGMIPGIPSDIHALITLGGYFVLTYAMMGSAVDYDEMFTKSRREAIYYGTFSLAAGLGPSVVALSLPQILEGLGYSVANPSGVRVAWLVTGGIALIGALIFVGYKLGDTPDETRQIMKLDAT